jgi:hypothetical protein
VRIDINENIHENVSKTATTEVNSSIKNVSVWLAMCKDVITNKQNPSRLADVFNICCEVLFAITQK